MNCFEYTFGEQVRYDCRYTVNCDCILICRFSLLYIHSGIKGETDIRKFNNERET